MLLSASVLSNSELMKLFIALTLLLLAAHCVGFIFNKLGICKVVGEITGGILLGPTFFGYFFPDLSHQIFQGFEGEEKVLSAFYWLGLIFLMFISGFEIERAINREDKKTIFALIVGSTLLPFVLGWLSTEIFDYSGYVGVKNNMPALTIIISIAIAVTSIPVISKIFIDLNIIHTRFAKIVITTATVHDIVLWGILSLAITAIDNNNLSFSIILFDIIKSFLFIGINIVLMPFILNKINQLKINLLIKTSPLGYIFVICFFYVIVASFLKVNVVFGALVAGMMVNSLSKEKFNTYKNHVREVSLALFIPLYLAIVGFKLNLINNFNVLFFISFLLFALLAQTLGTMIATRLIKKDWLTSLNFSVAMNTRGGPGIVLATIGFEYGIINEDFFTILIMLAIITSLLGGYWFRYVLNRKWHLLS